MIKTGVIFNDESGDHICHKAGRKVIVDVPQYAKNLEEEFIFGVRDATNDSSVRPGVKLIKNPTNNCYVMKTASCFYFVRKHESRIEIIVDDMSGMGFFSGLAESNNFKAHSDDDVVVFWLTNKITKKR